MNYKELKLRWSNRAIMMFEYITNKTFSITNNTDLYTFLYCVVAANNKESVPTFDAFMDDLDNDDTILPFLTEWFNSTLQMKEELNKKKEMIQVNQ